jgi:hypothetical protein
MCDKAAECAPEISEQMLAQARASARKMGDKGDAMLREAERQIQASLGRAEAERGECKKRCPVDPARTPNVEHLLAAAACAERPCSEFFPCIERIAREAAMRAEKPAK